MMNQFNYYLLLIHLSNLTFEHKYQCLTKLMATGEVPASLAVFSKDVAYADWPEKEAEVLLDQGIPFISLLDPLYPPQLLEIYRPPILLFYEGNIDLLQKRGLAIVGSRQMTAYGKEVIEGFMEELGQSENPPVIVSGLAQGVDGYAHYQALRQQLNPIAVVGSGLDQTYPRHHRPLDHLIRQRGLTLSEFPPGSVIQKYHFPMRNRIIAGLSQDVLIIEAAERSGSLITAQMALDENRNVWAVPGSIFSPYSKGCNDLIAQGARPIQAIREIFENLV